VKDDASVVEALRRAFVFHPDVPDSKASCPEPEQIWDAAHGDLDPSQTREVVGHLRGCASCAAEWSAAMGEREEPAEMNRAALAARRPIPPRRGLPTRWAWAAAAALLIVAAGGLAILVQRPFGTSDTSGSRTGAETGVRPLVADGETLPRERFLLRWEPVEEGALYSVKLFRPNLTPVSQARNLQQPEWLVPVETLSDLPSGETLAWRVEVQLVDGRRLMSGAFLVRLE